MQKVAQGFRAAGVACGQKKKGGLDLALILSDRPCNAAAVFTQVRRLGSDEAGRWQAIGATPRDF